METAVTKRLRHKPPPRRSHGLIGTVRETEICMVRYFTPECELCSSGHRKGSGVFALGLPTPWPE